MSCQACERPAAHIARTHGCAAHCCSPACAHAIYAGITALPGNTHYAVSAASPLGRAINRGNLVVPQSTLATLIGALQRIGPQMKRGADAAELDASTQAAAPVPVDWTVALPADAWGEILKRLERADLSTFGGINPRATALTQLDSVQMALLQRELTDYTAAVRYANPHTDDEQLRHLRHAFPGVAEMALALLLELDLELMDRLNFSRDIASYDKRLRDLLIETERNGPAIFVQPLLFPSHGFNWHGDTRQTCRVMPGLINQLLRENLIMYRSQIARQLLQMRKTRVSLVATIVETPESDSFFKCYTTLAPAMQGVGMIATLQALGAAGVDLSRPDIGANCLRSPVDTDIKYRNLAEFIRGNNIAINTPPDENGFRPISYALLYTNLETAIQILAERGQLYSVLAETPNTQRGAPWLREPFLFAGVPSLSGLQRDEFNINIAYHIMELIGKYAVTAAQQLKRQGYPSLFLQRNRAGLTPLAAYLAETTHKYAIEDFIFRVNVNNIDVWEPWELVNGRPAIMYAEETQLEHIINATSAEMRRQPGAAVVRELIFNEILRREHAFLAAPLGPESNAEASRIVALREAQRALALSQ